MSNRDKEVPEGFKLAEQGQIPAEWETVRLSEFAEVKYGKATPKDHGQIPVVGSGGVFSNTSIPLVDFPTIVIGRKGTAGKVWFCPSPCYPSDTAFYLRWRRDIDIPFVFYFMTLNPLSGEHAKTTVPSIQKPYLENMIIPLPPLLEQHAIAGVLSTVQKAIEAQDKIVAAARELKKSLMRHLFTYGPVPVSEAENVPLKETEIGPVPEHWKVVKAGKHLKIHAGGTPSRQVPEYWGGSFPWIKTGEVNYTRIMSTEETISLAGLHNSAAKLLPKGTLVMAMYGQGVTRGRVAILGIEAAMNQACAALIPDTTLSSEFLYTYFTYAYEAVRSLGHGAHQKNLSADIIKQIDIPVPPGGEQHLISSLVEIVEHKIRSEENRKAALQALFKTMLHLLMTGKMRVVGG